MERIEAGERPGNGGQAAAGLGKVGDGKVRPLSWGVAFTFTERNAEFKTDAAQPAQ
jgi:hypothetical protein